MPTFRLLKLWAISSLHAVLLSAGLLCSTDTWLFTLPFTAFYGQSAQGSFVKLAVDMTLPLFLGFGHVIWFPVLAVAPSGQVI